MNQSSSGLLPAINRKELANPQDEQATSTLTRQPGSQNIRIDALRALAIVMVFISHLDPAVNGNFHLTHTGWMNKYTDAPSLLQHFLRLTFFNGHLGVCLFFIISGLCIRLSHRAMKTYSTPHFYWRRAWRIYPAYLLALAISVFLYLHSGGDSTGLTFNIASHLLFAHNLFLGPADPLYSPFWSLQVEFQIYLLYPVLLFLHSRLGTMKTMLTLAILSIVTITITRDSIPFSKHLYFLKDSPFTLWFTWYLGFILADRMIDGAPQTPYRNFWTFFALLCYGLATYIRPLNPAYEVTIGIFLVLFVEVALFTLSLPSWFEKPAAWIGAISYSIYLTFDHIVFPGITEISPWFPALTGQPLFALCFILEFGVLCALAWICFHCVEKPGIAMGKHLYRKLV